MRPFMCAVLQDQVSLWSLHFGNILLTTQSFEAWVTIYAAIQESVGVQLPEEVQTIMPSLCGRSFLGYYEHYQTGS